jgi:protein arginine kinase activator
MVCDVCKESDAVIQLTVSAGTGVTQLHLCEKCAAERGVETTISMPKPALGDFLQSVHQQMSLGQGAGDAVRCTFCSATSRDFRSTGRLGCARCYSAFEASLRDLLRRVHGSSKHAGRNYEPPMGEELQRTSTMLELRDRLSRAIATEQFELAATIRDQLRGMES